MKMILVLAVLVAVACARPQHDLLVKKPFIPILFMSDVRDDMGQFTLTYVTGDGTTVMERGYLIPNPDGKDYVLKKEGSVTYTSPEGGIIKETYVADLDGYRVMGDHLPKSVMDIHM